MIRPRTLLVVSLLGAAAIIAACTSASGPSGGGTTSVPIANPSYATDIQPIFNANCNNAACHGTNATVANANLDLRSASSYASLVNVASSSEPSLDRVVPSDAANSYLVMKLEGTQSVGSRMPKGAPALGSVTIQNIKNWIANGAPNN